jgi:hypothetical protein
MLDVNAFGSPRARAWAQRINDAQNRPADRGFENAARSHPEGAQANQVQYNKTIRDTAPPIEGRTEMNKQPSTELGSGAWSVKI